MHIYVFKTQWHDPSESLIPILSRIERANALPAHVIAHLTRPDIDPYEGGRATDAVDI